MDLVDVVTLLVHSVGNDEQAHICWVLEHVVHLLDGIALDISLKSAPPGVHLTNSLLQTFLESTPDSHDFADTLHR